MTNVARLIDKAEDAGLTLVVGRNGHVLVYGDRWSSSLVLDEFVVNASEVFKELHRRVTPRHEPEVEMARIKLYRTADTSFIMDKWRALFGRDNGSSL